MEDNITMGLKQDGIILAQDTDKWWVMDFQVS